MHIDETTIGYTNGADAPVAEQRSVKPCVSCNSRFDSYLPHQYLRLTRQQ